MEQSADDIHQPDKVEGTALTAAACIPYTDIAHIPQPLPAHSLPAAHPFHDAATEVDHTEPLTGKHRGSSH